MNTKADQTEEASLVRPKYYEVDGAFTRMRIVPGSWRF